MPTPIKLSIAIELFILYNILFCDVMVSHIFYLIPLAHQVLSIIINNSFIILLFGAKFDITVFHGQLDDTSIMPNIVYIRYCSAKFWW